MDFFKEIRYKQIVWINIEQEYQGLKQQTNQLNMDGTKIHGATIIVHLDSCISFF